MYEQVKYYYGKVLKQSKDLKTNACCTDMAMPDHLKTILAKIHDEVSSRYYGCGLVRPELLSGTRILDLGCGAGRDCYVLSQLVGERGFVIGVDMTAEQLAVANRHIDYHRQQFGFAKANIEFKQGYIECLDRLDLNPNSFDIIVSNCVINLSPDKKAVLAEAYRLLKNGGELYFSDVYADRRVPAELVQDPVLYGECLSGALYWNDFINLAKNAGFADPRLVESRPITIENDAVAQRLGPIKFYSATYRLFKIEQLEPACEDYGQAVVYLGSIADHRDSFCLDDHHLFAKDKIVTVCGNTWRMLNESRFQAHFQFLGNWDHHYGIFKDCGLNLPFDENADSPAQKQQNTRCCQ